MLVSLALRAGTPVGTAPRAPPLSGSLEGVDIRAHTVPDTRAGAAEHEQARATAARTRESRVRVLAIELHVLVVGGRRHSCNRVGDVAREQVAEGQRLRLGRGASGLS